MLRVGLTGELGAGKSLVAEMLAERGAHVFSSDEMGRVLMQPGTDVFAEIVRVFGSGVVGADGRLDRGMLARMAFDPAKPRVEELNAIVHPAVLAEQTRVLEELEAREPRAIAVVESALIFSTKHAGEAGWRARFDVVVVVTAEEDVRVRRYAERVGGERAAAEAEARRRLAAQRISAEQIRGAMVVKNDGSVETLRVRVLELWGELQKLNRA